jgi:hypothetical protein
VTGVIAGLLALPLDCSHFSTCYVHSHPASAAYATRRDTVVAAAAHNILRLARVTPHYGLPARCCALCEERFYCRIFELLPPDAVLTARSADAMPIPETAGVEYSRAFWPTPAVTLPLTPSELRIAAGYATIVSARGNWPAKGHQRLLSRCPLLEVIY